MKLEQHHGESSGWLRAAVWIDRFVRSLFWDFNRLIITLKGRF